MSPEASPLAPADLEDLAAAEDWPRFFSALRDAPRGIHEDFATVHQAFRLASSREAGPVGADFAQLRVALLRNAALEPWLPHVFLAFVRRGMVPELWLGDYGVYEAYLARGDSKLKDFGPDLTLLYIDPEELAGDHAFSGGSELLESLRQRLHGLVDLLGATGGSAVVANLCPGPYGASTVYSAQTPMSWPNIRRALNVELVGMLAELESVHMLDLDGHVARFGADRARDVGSYYSSHVPFSPAFMPLAADAFAAVVERTLRPPRKCVVVDCDNTLWGGVLGEDGPSKLQVGGGYPGVLYRRFQLFLKSLLDQGFLLAINSKNNEHDVLDFMSTSADMVLRLDDFAARRINWEDKVRNLREIADELNIGLDSMIFIDDSAVECELVRSIVPEVQVEQFPESPRDIPAFMDGLRGLEVLRVTADDLKRAESMRANSKRAELRRSATDLEDFIRSLDIHLTIRRQPRDLVDRVSQLTQRTNQFNLTTRRYTVDEIRSLMDEEAVYTLGMRDKFADYGTIGVAIVRSAGDRAELDSLMLSCRAFGREVERTFVHAVLADLRERGVESVLGLYRESPKNAMVADFYHECGFSPVDGGEDGQRWELTLNTPPDIDPEDRYSIVTEGLA